MFFDVYHQLCMRENDSPNGVAKKIGIASSSITQWKQGAMPQTKTIQKVADYFNVPITIFFENEDSKENDENALRQEFLDILDSSDEEDLKNLLDMINLYKNLKRSSFKHRKTASNKVEAVEQEIIPVLKAGEPFPVGTYVCSECEKTAMRINTAGKTLPVCPHCKSIYWRKIQNTA